eukprot:7782582-Pyramimonas_sp.AAC.1
MVDAAGVLSSICPRSGQQRPREGLVEPRVLHGGLRGLHDNNPLRERLVGHGALVQGQPAG